MKRRAGLLALYLGFMVIAAGCNTAASDNIAASSGIIVHSNTSADFSENETDFEVTSFSETSSVTAEKIIRNKIDFTDKWGNNCCFRNKVIGNYNSRHCLGR